jgi:hypothetical protein
MAFGGINMGIYYGVGSFGFDIQSPAGSVLGERGSGFIAFGARRERRALTIQILLLKRRVALLGQDGVCDM